MEMLKKDRFLQLQVVLQPLLLLVESSLVLKMSLCLLLLSNTLYYFLDLGPHSRFRHPFSLSLSLSLGLHLIFLAPFVHLLIAHLNGTLSCFVFTCNRIRVQSDFLGGYECQSVSVVNHLHG